MRCVTQLSRRHDFRMRLLDGHNTADFEAFKVAHAAFVRRCGRQECSQGVMFKEPVARAAHRRLLSHLPKCSPPRVPFQMFNGFSTKFPTSRIMLSSGGESPEVKNFAIRADASGSIARSTASAVPQAVQSQRPRAGVVDHEAQATLPALPRLADRQMQDAELVAFDEDGWHDASPCSCT